MDVSPPIGRRGFALTLGATLLLPRPSGAQPKRMPRVGVLWPNPPATFEPLRQGLAQLGYVEGRTISFEYRWAERQLGQLPELAAELVALKVDIIVTLAPPATQAAKNATQTIPIVFVAVGDPVASGLIANFARPGGNLTGTTRMTSEMTVKHLEILKEAVPVLSHVGVLWNPGNSAHPPALRLLEPTARALHVKLSLGEVRSPADLEPSVASVVRERTDGLIFLPDPIFFIHLRRMVELVAAAQLPAITLFTEFPRLGGLMGYAPSLPEEFRRAAGHVDKILKGNQAGELPVQEPTIFEFVVNLKAAAALGLRIPRSLLLRADEVIQ